MPNNTYSQLIKLLDQHKAQYRLIDHASEGRTELVSAMRGNSLSQAANCIVVMVKVGKKTTKFVLAVYPADQKLDLNAVKALFNGTYVSFASPDIAERLAGSVLGTVLPFSLNEELELIVDPTLLTNEEIFFNAARLDQSVALRASDYAKIAKPRLESIVKGGLVIPQPQKKEIVVDDLHCLRHSLAHVLAQAVATLWPGTQITIGPPIDTGCYYDFLFAQPISDIDLPKIEKEMKKIIYQGQTFRCDELNVADAKKFWRKLKQNFKVELIEDLEKNEKVKTVTHYTNIGPKGEDTFTDLCRGGHVESTKDIPVDAFKVTTLAGSYWRGDEKREQLTRIYVVAFSTKAELEAHLKMVEEAKKRDHRKLGEELDLFHFDESIGKGLPMWLPKGNIIKEALETWAKETEEAWGYQRVTTPIITKEELFHTSGHLPLYKDSMYAPIKIENETYYIKPMNCPFHHKCFGARPKSYKELPVRYAEYGWCHRYEDSGSLFGLMRVRGMQMNDAHIYVQKENAVEEFIQVIRLHEYYYKVLGITNYEMELALRDPKKMDKYHGDESDWVDAEKMTIEAMEKSGVPFKVLHEGAAFYGPKMDFQIYSSIGRAFTASTNQLDLYMGKRFNLEYVDKDGQKKIPAIIHRAPLGTHERFVGFLIEHFAGLFPLWLAPVQVNILPVAGPHEEAAATLAADLKKRGVRVEVLPSSDSLGKRIRDGEMMKVPYLLVLGDREIAEKTVTVRNVKTKKQVGVPEMEFIKSVIDDIKGRKLSASLS